LLSILKYNGASELGTLVEYLTSMETQLRKWSAGPDVVTLTAAAKKASAAARAKFNEQVEAMRFDGDATRRRRQYFER
jgi:hypothetical protein